jgi:hypothetical protein
MDLISYMLDIWWFHKKSVYLLNMRFLTTKQKLFLIRKNIHKGGMYMFPAMGFTVYAGPSYEDSIHMETNPFTKSLAHEQFVVKDIINGFCKGNFYSKPHKTDFYITQSELENRGLIEILILFVITSIPMTIYNWCRGGVDKVELTNTKRTHL